MRKLIIGVDGGGTKTNLAAWDIKSGRIVSRSNAGSIHSYSMGMDTAVKNLLEGISGLGLERNDRILALSIGDPALDDSTEEPAESLRNYLISQELFSPETKILACSDVFMALYALAGGAPAALMVAGTGSMGIALKRPYRHGEKNEILTVGGWGEPTRDAGSGQAIAVDGILAAMDAFDEVAPPTQLCQEVMDFYGVQSPRALIDIFNSDFMNRSKLAAFAVRVDVCAAGGDRTAAEILEKNGVILGKYVRSLLRHMETDELCAGVYGSVLLHNETVREAMIRTVHEEFPEARILLPELPPECGAIRYAADALGIPWKGENQ